MGFIPEHFESQLLASARARMEGAIAFAERAGDPLGDLADMKQLVVDIDARLADIQK